MRKKNAPPTTSFVSRLLYFTCMKNRMTSVALMIAIAIATGKFSTPRLMNATHDGDGRQRPSARRR